MEVNRPNRQHRRRFGKHDTADAESAARAVQAGTAVGQPKSADGTVEMLRALRVARRSAVKARTQAANQLRALVFTASEELRTELRGLSTAKLVSAAARLRPGRRPADPTAATKMAIRSIARRHRWLSDEIAELDEQLERLVAEAAPALVALRGVGTETAASLLVAAGDNPERLRNWDERTREYVARRTAGGKSKGEILRCLKRYVAREIYRVLASPTTGLPAPTSAP